MKAQTLSPTPTAQVSIKACGLYARLILCGLLFIYVCIYPPVVATCFIELSTRLAVETLILLIFVFYVQLKSSFKVPKDLVWLIVLVLLYWIFSLEKSRQVLSFFNKFIFFIFLVRVIHEDQGMFLLLRKFWVAIWFILSISAILACVSFTFDIVPFSNFKLPGYAPQWNPFLGLVLPKHITGILTLPRYSGWCIEPGYLAFFFGANALISNSLFTNVNMIRCFRRLNTFAGFLTFSVVFYAFFLGFYLYQMICRTKVMPRTRINLIFFLFSSFLLFYVYKNPWCLPYTSITTRIGTFEGAWEVFINMDIKHLIFGFGTIPLQNMMGGGSSSGLTDILLGKGLLLSFFIILLIFRYTKHNPPLLCFIIFYSLAFSVLWHPLFLFVVALGYESYFYNNHQFSPSFNRQERVNKRLF